MNKIEIGKSCYGEYASVDDIEVTMCTYYESKPELKEQANVARTNILQTLVNMKDSLSDSDWCSILEIIVNNNYESIKESEHHRCETCGDYNYNTTYQKIDSEKQLDT